MRPIAFLFYPPYNRERLNLLRGSHMLRLRNWFHTLSLRQQWATGCAGIVVMVTACLYGLGLVSYFARPALLATPPPATVLFQIPTLAPQTILAPTAPPTLNLPASTLVATPTQAPIPTRAPTNTATITPTLELDANGTPIFPTLTVTP